MAFFKKCNCTSGGTPRARARPKQAGKTHARHGAVSYTYCPSCSYRIRETVQGTGVIPEGLPASVLLSNSPAAQILLTDKNRVQYANKAAIHLLGSTRNHILEDVGAEVAVHEGKDILGPVTPPRLQKRASTGPKAQKRGTKNPALGSRLENYEDTINLQESTVHSLEGLSLKELPMDLDEETRRWINLEQMVETIKLSLRRESERIMQDFDDQTGFKGKDDEFYRKYYDIEDETDKIAEYYKAMAERDALRDEEEKRRQEELKARAEVKENVTDEGLGSSQQRDKQDEPGPNEGNKEDQDAATRSPAPTSIKSGGTARVGLPQLELDAIDEFGSNTLIAKQSVPVIVFRKNMKSIYAKIYVALILPGGGGGTTITEPYTSLSILPSDAILTEDEIQPKDSKETGALSPVKQADVATTGAAAKVLGRVTRLKDMILDEMDYFFMCLTPDGNVCVTNKATKELLGVAGEASVGEGIEWITRLDIFREDFSERLPFEEWALNTMMQDGKPVAQMIGMYTQPPNPRRLSLQLRGKPLWKDESRSEMLAALAVVVDQTEFSAREKMAKNKNDIKNGFLKMLEWKIKTPISGAIGLLNMFYQTPGLGDEQKEFLENMYRTMNTLMLVVNELSNFSQIEQKRLNLEKTLFSVDDLIKDLQKLCNFSFIKDGIDFHVVVDGLRQQSRSKGTSILSRASEQFDIEEIVVEEDSTGDLGAKAQNRKDNGDTSEKLETVDGSDLVVIGDEKKLRGILICLLSNAFKFTHQGQVTFTSQLDGEVEDGIQKVRFEIQDTGIGFSKETQRRLLLSLDEVIMSDATAPGASGLGFAIAKSHADILGAELGCTSEPDKGSTFHLVVPLEMAPDHAKTTLDENRKHNNIVGHLGLVIRMDELQQPSESDKLEDHDDIEQSSRRLRLDGKNILVVEDNWAHQVVTEKRLGMMGCKTKIAVNGQNALTLLKKGEFAPDIIMMDLQMPMMDGFQTTERIRNDPELARFKHVPIIAVTASGTDDDRRKATEVGMDDFTLKPLHAEYLKVLLEMALRKGLDRMAADKSTSVEIGLQKNVKEERTEIAEEGRKPAHGHRNSTIKFTTNSSGR